MFTVALFGAGKIGEAICGLLGPSGRYKIKVCDTDAQRAKAVAAMWPKCEGFALDLNDKKSSLVLLNGCDAVMSALPYFCNPSVAALAHESRTHYFDLTEDVATTDKVAEIAKDSSVCFMPQCGLAPGFISIAAFSLAQSFDKPESIKMRVGALPIFPSNRLKYNLTWSTDGLINEYGNMCEAVIRGKKRLVLPLEGYERFSLDGIEYEAFNTSGGLGTLVDTLDGKIQDLDYKSVRYKGHRDLMAFLMNDLQFNEDRESLKKVFERSITTTRQDKCIIFVEVRGQSKGRYLQRTYASTIYNAMINNQHLSAIQLTTAAGICAPLDLVLSGKTKNKSGFICCEDISLSDFLANEFGKHYRDEKALQGLAA